MTPKFEIIQGDNVESLKRLAEQGRKFDAIVADPPYCSGGMNPADIMCSGGIKKYIDREDLGTFTDAMSQRAFLEFSRMWLRAARDVLKPCAYIFIFIDWRQLPTITDALQTAGYIWRGVAVWEKGKARANLGHITQTQEFIVWGTAGTAKSSRVVTPGTICAPSPKCDDRIHPTQKSADVIARLLDVLPPDASDVLDPFSGSGSTGVAALSKGLNYTGLEEVEMFVDASRGRLAESLKALELTGQFVDKKRAADAPVLF